jgi:hypothetical protein
MPTPSNPLQAAIFARLTGFSALTTLLGGASQIVDFAPEELQPPYVQIGDDTAIDWSTKTDNGWSTTITIHCWDFEKAGRKSVKAILSAIYDALHEQEASIPIAGFNLIMLRYEFEHTLQDPSAQGQGDRYYHGIQRYRALIQA